MSNRLAQATSPYLLQHAENPVDWWEWSQEAFAEAKARNVPVLLSVGYAACHWCHVMAHESFEHEATAAYLNEHFVSVKVDREERPDIDAVYMEATQAMTGQGGWPMTCFLTAAGQPFFTGTYFPLHPHPGLPAFGQVLQAVVAAWTDRRDELTTIGSHVVDRLQRAQAVPAATSTDPGAAAVAVLGASFDQVYAGFGEAPKFPPSMVCEFLLRRAARAGDTQALRMAEQTLEAMARGGLYDQLGGGFARYSVDAHWDVPHFEKMLYDNALLLRVYVHWWRQSEQPLAERVARGTADFLLRELRTDEGGFASALDADSDGEEGTFYVWSPQDLVAALGETEGAAAAATFGVSDRGNFEAGKSTLRLDAEPSDVEAHRQRVTRLLEARERRTRPARDDKVVAAWNGLTVAALAEAGMLLGESRYLDAALAAGALLVDVHLDETGRVRRVSRDGKVGTPAGILEDYGCVAEAFLVLFGCTGDAVWHERATDLMAQVRSRFSDGRGGFYDTAADSETLVKRPQDPGDNATPSGQAMTASVLLTLSAMSGSAEDRDSVQALLSSLAGLAEQAPRFAGQTLSVAEALLDGPRQVAVIGADQDARRQALVRAAYRLPHPGLVIAQGQPGQAAVALLDGRGLVRGEPAAYVCHDFVCDLPVTDPADVG